MAARSMRAEILSASVSLGACVALTITACTANPAAADGNYESLERARMVIKQWTTDLCAQWSNKSTVSRTELSGEVSAGVNGLVARLADLGVSGKALTEIQNAEGPLQKDLPQLVADTNKCNLAVANMLLPKLWPSPSGSGRQSPLELERRRENSAQSNGVLSGEYRGDIGMHIQSPTGSSGQKPYSVPAIIRMEVSSSGDVEGSLKGLSDLDGTDDLVVPIKGTIKDGHIKLTGPAYLFGQSGLVTLHGRAEGNLLQGQWIFLEGRRPAVDSEVERIYRIYEMSGTLDDMGAGSFWRVTK